MIIIVYLELLTIVFITSCQQVKNNTRILSFCSFSTKGR